jgi:peptidyl-prolyl cis-trans isomerase SurA
MDPSAFVPPFAKAVRSLPLNSLSQPIQTQFGWHIIEVLERKTSDQTREALKLQAQSLISKDKKKDDYNNWLQGIRDEAFVEYRIKL